MIRLLLGLLVAVSCVALAPNVSSAVTFTWTVDCAQVVVGPVTVLPVNFNGTVDLTLNVPATIALLPTANLIRRDNPAAPPGTHTGVLSCTLTFGGVTVPFTRSLTLVIGAGGTGDMTVGPVSVFVNLGPTAGTVTLSAPSFTTIGYDPGIPIIVVPLVNNTTALLSPPGIPTLSTWAMMVLVMAMLGAGLVFLRRVQRRV
jgi:IPTL-CTERM motif